MKNQIFLFWQQYKAIFAPINGKFCKKFDLVRKPVADQVDMIANYFTIFCGTGGPNDTSSLVFPFLARILGDYTAWNYHEVMNVPNMGFNNGKAKNKSFSIE